MTRKRFRMVCVHGVETGSRGAETETLVCSACLAANQYTFATSETYAPPDVFPAEYLNDPLKPAHRPTFPFGDGGRRT